MELQHPHVGTGEKEPEIHGKPKIKDNNRRGRLGSRRHQARGRKSRTNVLKANNSAEENNRNLL